MAKLQVQVKTKLSIQQSAQLFEQAMKVSWISNFKGQGTQFSKPPVDAFDDLDDDPPQFSVMAMLGGGGTDAQATNVFLYAWDRGDWRELQLAQGKALLSLGMKGKTKVKRFISMLRELDPMLESVGINHPSQAPVRGQAPPEKRSAAPPNSFTARDKRFCTACGKAVEEADRFCRECGNPIDAEDRLESERVGSEPAKRVTGESVRVWSEGLDAFLEYGVAGEDDIAVHPRLVSLLSGRRQIVFLDDGDDREPGEDRSWPVLPGDRIVWMDTDEHYEAVAAVSNDAALDRELLHDVVQHFDREAGLRTEPAFEPDQFGMGPGAAFQFDPHSPNDLATQAQDRYNHQDFASALTLFEKAIDMLHTLYLFENMRQRQPSAADAWIVDGFVSALGATRAMNPSAEVSESVRVVTHRLRTIATRCQSSGASSDLYLDALARIGDYAKDVRVDDILWN